MKNNNFYRNDATKENHTELVVNKLIDVLIDSEFTVSSEFAYNLLLDILTIKDSYGIDVFSTNTSLQLDDYSISILEMAINNFLSQVDEFISEFDLEVDLDSLHQLMSILKANLKSLKISKDNNKVSFITIPVNEGTVLHHDINGENSLVSFNGVEYHLKSPHKHQFNLKHGSDIDKKTNAELILSELDKIENTLAYDPCIVKHTARHKPFQSEDGSQVKRNVQAGLRIQLNQYNDNAVSITGIYRKIGQVDQEVQTEYNNRKNVLDKMKNDPNISVQQCQEAYYGFKSHIIGAVYSSQLDKTGAIKQYMVCKDLINNL